MKLEFSRHISEEHSNTQTLKCSNAQTLKRSNTQTLKCSNAQMLKHPNTQTLKHLNTQTLKHSNIKLQQNRSRGSRVVPDRQTDGQTDRPVEACSRFSQFCEKRLKLSKVHLHLQGHVVAQLVEALRYKPEGRGFNSRWFLWNFALP